MITSYSYRCKSEVIASPVLCIFAAKDIINMTCASVQLSDPSPTRSSTTIAQAGSLVKAARVALRAPVAADIPFHKTIRSRRPGNRLSRTRKANLGYAGVRVLHHRPSVLGRPSISAYRSP